MGLTQNKLQCDDDAKPTCVTVWIMDVFLKKVPYCEFILLFLVPT